MPAPPTPVRPVAFRDACKVWMRIGLLSFGGPAGQIALMHRMVVAERGWVSDTRFMHALNYCMLLPGPEAQQLATYLGWLLHGVRGGLVAGTLFILPGLLVMLALSMLVVTFGDFDTIRGVLFGLQAATLAIVVDALARVGRRALKTAAHRITAIAAFVALFGFGAPFPLVIAMAAMIGLLVPSAATTADPADAHLADPPPPSRGWYLRTIGLGVLLWLGPVAVLAAALGPTHVYTQEAVFFGKMAMVTFGGAYAVLTYIAQQAVEVYGWLLPTEMIQGLALAETTPGPLILVLSYVGFLGGWRHAGLGAPLLGGVGGALIATWVSFVPCFLLIFLGAPFVERLRGNRRLAAALASITAAVVGVMASLSLWFALHVLFGDVSRWQAYGLDVPAPQWQTLDPAALALGALAMMGLLSGRLGVGPLLLLAATGGVLLRAALG